MKKYLILAIFCLAQIGYCQNPTPGQFTGTLSAAGATCFVTNACVVANIPTSVGLISNSATITVQTNASGNTIQFEQSGDNGTTWVSLSATPQPSGTNVTSTTGTGVWTASVASMTNVRLRMSTLVGGTTAVVIQLSPAVASTSGNLGVIPISSGGTGQITAQAAIAALLPPGTSGQCAISTGATWTAGNCVQPLTGSSSTATLINVTFDSPGTANAGGCTLIFTQGMTAATASTSTCFTGSNVGSIIQYNSGTAPNFRAVVTGVNGTSITMNTIFPAPTTGAISFNSGLPSNSWNSIADPCAQIAASLTNHPNARLDASTVAPAAGATCTISPFVAPVVFSPGGSLALYGKWTTQRSWYMPAGQFKTYGQVGWSGANGATANNWTNAFVVADNANCVGGTVSCFITQQYEANNLSTSSATTSASTFADNNASGACTSNTVSCAFQQVISTTSPSGTCPNGLTGPGYCYFQMNNAMNGFLEGQNITFTDVASGAGSWAGGFMLTGVSGLWGAFYCGLAGGCQTTQAAFPVGTVNTQNAANGSCAANCVSWVSGTTFATGSNWVGATISINGSNFTISSVQSSTLLTIGSAPGTLSGVAYNLPSSANMVTNDTLQGYFSPSAAGSTFTAVTGQTPPSGIGGAEKQITVATGAFTFGANDGGSCQITCTAGTGSGCATAQTVNIAQQRSTTAAAYSQANAVTWSGVSATYKCYYQSPITSVVNGSTTTLNTQVPMQNIAAATASNYSIATPVISVGQLGSSAGIFPDSVMVEDIGIQCPSAVTNTLAAGVGLQFFGQEMAHWLRIHTLGCSGDSVQDFGGHEAQSGQSDMDMFQTGCCPPTAHGVAFFGSAGGSHVNANQFTILGYSGSGGSTISAPPYSEVQVYGISDLHLGDVHCEQFTRCVDLGPTALGSGMRVQLDSIEPGVGGYEGVHIRSNGNLSLEIANLWATNVPNNALLVDDNLAGGCGAGTTYANGSTSGSGIGLYAEGNGNGSSHTRIITDSATAANCMQSSSAGLNALGTISGATATVNMNQGSVVTMTLAASVTTFTVNNPVNGQQMDLTIQENGTGAFTFAFPATFKGFTAINTAANECNVYHAMYDGVNWSQVGAVNAFVGPCL